MARVQIAFQDNDESRYIVSAIEEDNPDSTSHVMLIDLSNKHINGKQAEIALGNAGIALNKNMVPFDTRSPFVTSGIRIGTPAITTRGMGKDEMKQITSWIDLVIKNPENETILKSVKKDVNSLCQNFQIYHH